MKEHKISKSGEFDIQDLYQDIHYSIIKNNDLNTFSTQEEFQQLADVIFKIPEDFKAHNIVQKTYKARYQSIVNGKNIDWATAEALAFGTLIQNGFGVRLTGEDVGRGTFSHRHIVLTDQDTNKYYSTFEKLEPNKNQKLFTV